MVRKILCVFGTRPEAIKMAPVVQQLQQLGAGFETKICVSGQHREMLDQVLDLFDLRADYDLKVMKPGQTLSTITVSVINGLTPILIDYRPEMVLVHGDTTTSMAAGLCAYYHQIDVAHVEAGLRTGDVYSPFPEEVNRKITSTFSALNFSPTTESAENLKREGVLGSSIFTVGNTVIDALLKIKNRLDNDEGLAAKMREQFSFLSPNKKLILVTGHRRESFGKGLDGICQAIRDTALERGDVEFIYPVHLNPNVREPVNRILGNVQNIHLIGPIEYLPFVYLMNQAFLILTDSGGIQEEAPSLGKPVLITRDVTERPEVIANGAARLVGTNYEVVHRSIRDLLSNGDIYSTMAAAGNPYGDGHAAERIAGIVRAHFVLKKPIEIF